MCKKIIVVMSLAILVLIVTGCGSLPGNTIVDDMIEISEREDIDLEVAKDEAITGVAVGDIVDVISEFEEKDFSRLEDVEVDEDISILPATLAFAQTSRMMFDLESYEGKSVKMKGMYYHELMPELDIDRKSIMLLDETSCCQGYLEIVLPDGIKYPESGTSIMVVGEYQIETNGEYSYPIIKVTDYIF